MVISALEGEERPSEHTLEAPVHPAGGKSP